MAPVDKGEIHESMKNEKESESKSKITMDKNRSRNFHRFNYKTES